MAHLDDVTVICGPERVRTTFTIIDEELARHAHVNIHYGKTQVWNRGGVAPEGIDELTSMARLVKPAGVVWGGDTQLPFELQGVRRLGVPIGSPDFVRQQLGDKSAGARSFVPSHSPDGGYPSMLGFVAHVCCNQGELLIAPQCTLISPSCSRSVMTPTCGRCMRAVL